MFGHPGLTLGAALLLARVFNRPSAAGEAGTQPDPEEHRATPDSALTALGRRIDLRLLLIGSLLPDIIDKPLGMVFLRDVYQNGRIFAHTLLFLLALTACAVYRYRRRRGTGLLALAFGSLMHLVEDQMWRNPRTLLYPLHGFSFAPLDLSRWLPETLYALFIKPAVYLPELAGAAVLLWFGWRLWRRKKLYPFIAFGRV